MERKYGDDFDFEIITEGSFRDEGYNISTIVIRLNCTAMNDWIMSGLTTCTDTSRIDEELVDCNAWEEFTADLEEKRKAWERKILDKLKFKADTGYTIAQSVSEIFTVVLFEKE